MIAFLTGVLGPLIVILVNHYLNKRKKPDIVSDALETSKKVMAKLDTLKEDLDADRLWVTQFHNGGNFYPTGKSMAKFSVIYETVSVGVASIQSNFQNVQVNLFSKSITHLFEENMILIPDFKDETVATYGLKYLIEICDSKSSYLFSIKTIDGKFIGVLGLEYTKRKSKITDEDIKKLIGSAAAIGGVLTEVRK